MSARWSCGWLQAECTQCWVFRWGVMPQVECSRQSSQPDGRPAGSGGWSGGWLQVEGRQGWVFVQVCGCKQGAADNHGSPWASLQAVCQSTGMSAQRWSRRLRQPRDTPAHQGRAALNMLACSLWHSVTAAQLIVMTDVECPSGRRFQGCLGLALTSCSGWRSASERLVT